VKIRDFKEKRGRERRERERAGLAEGFKTTNTDPRRRDF